MKVRHWRGGILGWALFGLLVGRTVALAEHFEGRLIVYYVDDFASRRATAGYQLQTSAAALPLELIFRAPPALRSNDTIAVDGTVRPDGAILVEQASRTSAGRAVRDALRPPSGDQRTAVFLVDFRDATNACTLGQVEDLLFGAANSVSNAYREVSFQAVSFSGTAFGPFLVDDYRSLHCNPFGWAADVDRQAVAAGIDLNAYPRRVYVTATNPQYSCGYAGEGQLGIEPSASVVEGYGACGYSDVYAHELGHNLGMSHASTDPGDDGTIDDEYGDQADFMGGPAGLPTGHPNVPHKLQMAWVEPEEVPLLSSNTRLLLRPLELSSSPDAPIVGARIPKSGVDGQYFVGLRRRLGLDGALPDGSLDRVSVHTYGAFLADHTALVRTLAPSESFLTPDFAVSYLGDSATGALVEVAFSCEAFAPRIAPPASTVRPGTTTAIAVSVTNDDTALCDATTFGVGVTAPEGWQAAPASAAVGLAPKATRSFDLTVTVPSDAPDGNYLLSVTLTDPAAAIHAVAAQIPVRVEACGIGCEVCGNAHPGVGEECDDGNLSNADTCDTNCTFPRCGNGIVGSGEQCDDGNATAGDGCSDTCQRECVDDQGCSDGDPCRVGTCDGGSCRQMEASGLDGAICTAGAIARVPLCRGVTPPRALRRAFQQTANRTRALLRKARAASRPARREKLLGAAERQLSALMRTVQTTLDRGKIDRTCASTLAAKIGRPQELIAAERFGR